MVGETFEVLVSGKSRRENQWIGTYFLPSGHKFHFPRAELLGKYVQVRVTGATPNSLWGAGFLERRYTCDGCGRAF